MREAGSLIMEVGNAMARNELLSHLIFPLIAGIIGGIAANVGANILADRWADKHRLSIDIAHQASGIFVNRADPDKTVNYTVHVENTGDFTEQRIVLLVTLSDYLDTVNLLSDPFASSPSELVASQLNGAKFTGSDLSKEFRGSLESLAPGEFIDLYFALDQVPDFAFAEVRSSETGDYDEASNMTFITPQAQRTGEDH